MQSNSSKVSEVTSQIQVEVTNQYLSEESDEEHFVFKYFIKISNLGDRPVQLINRKWVINDSIGKETEVKGDGVVGKQPKLGEGEVFEYSSWTILNSPVGFMKGHYGMVYEDNEESFDIKIPVFHLQVPTAIN